MEHINDFKTIEKTMEETTQAPEVIEDPEPPTLYGHYVLLDIRGCVVDAWSTGSRPNEPTDGAVLLRESESYQFRLVEGGEENPIIMINGVVPLYRWDGQQVICRTPEEIAADEAAQASAPIPPDYQAFLRGLWEVFSDEQ